MGGCSSALSVNTTSISEFSVSCKIAIVGDPGCGKSSILKRFTANAFSPSYEPTTEADIAIVVKKLNVPDNLIASISFWDTPGRDDIDLRKTYFENLDAAIVVADTSSPSSLQLAGTWRQLVINAVTRRDSEGGDNKDLVFSDIPMILLANKYDKVRDVSGEEETSHEQEGGGESPQTSLNGEQRSLEGEVQRVVKTYGFLEGFMVSAKDRDGGVHAALQFLLRHLAESRLPSLPGSAFAHDQPEHSSGIVESSEEADQPPSNGSLLQEVIQMKGQFAQARSEFRGACQSCPSIVPKDFTLDDVTSLEDCILRLRESVGSDGLQTEPDGDFVHLQLTAKETHNASVTSAVRVFNTQIATVCNAILLKLPQWNKHLNFSLHERPSTSTAGGDCAAGRTTSSAPATGEGAALAAATIALSGEVASARQRVESAFLW